MAGGVCAPLLRISSAERRRLVLYRIAKMRKEKEVRQCNMESTPHSYKKTFSLEDHKLQIEIERIEMQRRQAVNKAKEEKHMFKMSVKVPTRHGQEYFSQYGEQFRANGDVLQHGSVTKLPHMLKSFHEENERFAETNLRTINHGSRSPSSPCKRSIISSLLKNEGIIDFLTTAITDKDREFMKSSLSSCCTDGTCCDEPEVLSKDVNSELALSPEFQKLQNLFHGKDLKDSETRKKELKKLCSLLDRYGISAQNKISCLSNVLSLLESTPDLASQELNNSLMYPEEDVNGETGESRGSCFIKPSKSVSFQDERVEGNEYCFSSKAGKNSALTPRVRKISTNIEGTGWPLDRETFCSSPSKRLAKHKDSAVSSYCDMGLGNGDDSQVVPSTPITTVDSEYMRAELYACYGGWTDVAENETGLLKTHNHVKKLERNEESKVIYSRANCKTMEKSTNTLHSGRNTGLKRSKDNTCFGCKNGRLIKSERKCASTFLCDTSTYRHADHDLKRNSNNQYKAGKPKKSGRNISVDKDTANTRTSYHGTNSKTNTSIYNLSPSMKISYSTRDVQPVPPRARNTNVLADERGPELQPQVSQVTARVQSVHMPNTNFTRSQKSPVPSRQENNTTGSQKNSKSDTHSTNVAKPSDRNRQPPKNIASGNKFSRTKSVNTTKRISRAPARAKSVTGPGGQHTENGNGTLMVSGKKLQARSVVSQEENDRQTRSKMEQLFKSIENLKNARRQSRSSARSRSASMSSRSHSEGSHSSSTRSRAGSAVESRDHTKHGLPVGQRTRKPKDNEGQYRRAKIFPVEVWSSKG